MRKLETYVNEKLRVTKNTGISYLIDILESKDIKEYESNCEQLLDYLNNYSNLPIAELEGYKNSFKELSRKYENTDDTFLWVYQSNHIFRIFYGTWDDIYSMCWSKANNRIINYIINYDLRSGLNGFKEFTFNDQEISESGGVFIITENAELMEQIDYLIKNTESRS